MTNHLRELRMGRGYSLADLAGRLGGVVTRQMLHKYEHGSSKPSPGVAARLAEALGVRESAIFARPVAAISCAPVGFRHYRGLGKKEMARIEKELLLTLGPRLAVRAMLAPEPRTFPTPTPVRTADDIEAAALRLRQMWNLGTAPVARMAATIEERGIQVVPVEADPRFDGTAVVVKDARGRRVAWAIATRTETCGERQRFSLAHEMGHLVLAVPGEADDAAEEQAAHDFAGAFLAPAETVRRTVGVRRREILLEEMLMLKRRFGMSMQALLFRLRALNVISDAHFDRWSRRIATMGWRSMEPGETPQEETVWLEQAVLRLHSERIASPSELREMFAASPERERVEALLRHK